MHLKSAANRLRLLAFALIVVVGASLLTPVTNAKAATKPTVTSAKAATKPAVPMCGSYYQVPYDKWFPHRRYKLTRVKPRSIFYDCGTGSKLFNIKWRRYGHRSAVARAKLRWSRLSEGYDARTMVAHVTIRLYRPRTIGLRRNVRTFTRLRVNGHGLPRRLTGTIPLRSSGPGEGWACNLGFQRQRVHRPCIKLPLMRARYYRHKGSRSCYIAYGYGSKRMTLWHTYPRGFSNTRVRRTSRRVYYSGPRSVAAGGTRYVFTRRKLRITHAFGEGTSRLSRTSRC